MIVEIFRRVCDGGFRLHTRSFRRGLTGVIPSLSSSPSSRGAPQRDLAAHSSVRFSHIYIKFEGFPVLNNGGLALGPKAADCSKPLVTHGPNRLVRRTGPRLPTIPLTGLLYLGPSRSAAYIKGPKEVCKLRARRCSASRRTWCKSEAQADFERFEYSVQCDCVGTVAARSREFLGGTLAYSDDRLCSTGTSTLRSLQAPNSLAFGIQEQG